MNRVKGTLVASASMVILFAATGHAQAPALMQTPPKPLIAGAKPVRSCESLATVSLPNTTIESAMLDATTRAFAASSQSRRIRRPATRSGSGSRFPRRIGTDGSSAPEAAGSPAATRMASISRRRWGLQRARPTPVTPAATRRLRSTPTDAWTGRPSAISRTSAFTR